MQDLHVGECLTASFGMASRIGRAMFTTLNRIRAIATSEPPPIDDGWEVIEADDPFASEDQTEDPEANQRPIPAAEISEDIVSDGEAVRNYRAAEREVGLAIRGGDRERESASRKELSLHRHQVWAKDNAAWATAKTHGNTTEERARFLNEDAETLFEEDIAPRKGLRLSPIITQPNASRTLDDSPYDYIQIDVGPRVFGHLESPYSTSGGSQ